MQAMLSDKKGRVLIIAPGIGYRYEQENFSLITNYSILKPDITKPYIVSGDTRYEVAKELLEMCIRDSLLPLAPRQHGDNILFVLQ